MNSLMNALVSGLISGSLYAIMALGMSIIYGVSHVFNFGHGVIAVMGGYFAWSALTKLGLGIIPSTLVSMVIMAGLGWILYRLAMSRLLKNDNWEFAVVIFTLGLGVLLENILLQFYGPRVKAIDPFFEGALKLGTVQVNWHDLSLMLAVLLSVVLLNLFFTYTRMGQAMLAVAQSLEGARVVGINVDKIFGYTFALAFLVTGFSGVLLSTKYYMTPHIGWDFMSRGFVIVAFGGLGSLSGAVLAALILGIVEGLATLYLGSVWVWPVWFVVFMVILLIRPQGILGGRTI